MPTDRDSDTAQATRPHMRGMLHAWAAGASLIAAPALCWAAAVRAGSEQLVGCVVYSVTLCGLFAISALFHRVTWNPRAYVTMKRVDHAMIYVFIAGCYTAFSLLLLPHPLAERMLAAVWIGALVGVALKVAWPRAPRWIGFPPYVLLGCLALVVLPEFLARGGAVTVGLLLAGGAVYIVGGACWAMRWPNPWPRTFGHHEIFHAAVIVGATVHHVALYAVLYA